MALDLDNIVKLPSGRQVQWSPPDCPKSIGISPDGFPGHVPGSECSRHHRLEDVQRDLEHGQAAHDAHKHDERLKLQLESLLDPLLHWICICAQNP